MNALVEVPIEQLGKFDDVKARLRNWVQYRNWKSQSGPVEYVSPLGRLYIAPKDEQRREAKRLEPDLIDGFLVDQCICKLPAQNRNALMVVYLGWLWVNGRRVDIKTANERHRMLGVSSATYYRLIERSMLMLKNILTREKNRGKKSINSDMVEKLTQTPGA